LGDKVRVEANAEWLQFSNFQRLDLDAGNNTILLPGASIPQHWRDTFTAGLGADWQFASSWIARLSYQYYQSPVPDETYSPTIPDADQNVVTVGLAFRRGRHSFECAYGAVFYEDRTIRGSMNPAYDGDYEVQVHLMSASYRLSF
jgi:long-chain fatty acid transport protein